MLAAVLYRVLSGQGQSSGISGCLLLHQWGLFLMYCTIKADVLNLFVNFSNFRLLLHSINDVFI
jgi:hypothetical protein